MNGMLTAGAKLFHRLLDRRSTMRRVQSACWRVAFGSMLSKKGLRDGLNDDSC